MQIQHGHSIVQVVRQVANRMHTPHGNGKYRIVLGSKPRLWLAQIGRIAAKKASNPKPHVYVVATEGLGQGIVQWEVKVAQLEIG